MNKEDLKVKAERYVELLSSYDHYVEAMEKTVQKIAETRKELMFFRRRAREERCKNKGCGINNENRR